MTTTRFRQLVALGDDRIIGRFLHNGFPTGDSGDVGRNVRSIVNPISGGHDSADDAVHVYVR